MSDKNDRKDQLLNLLLNHFGSQEAAWEQASRSALKSLLERPGITFGELMDAAQEGGWIDYLRHQPLRVDALSSSMEKPAAGRNKRGSNTGKVLSYLASHPKSSAADIAEATDLESSIISSTLQYLAKSSKVKGAGTGRSKVWSVK